MAGQLLFAVIPFQHGIASFRSLVKNFTRPHTDQNESVVRGGHGRDETHAASIVAREAASHKP
jgi:hypothetical protein